VSELPLTSIIIVTWNSAAYLPRCLESLSAQTDQSFEVILVDNGSKDNTTLGLEAKFPALNLHVERLESNRGIAVANNIGGRLAHGQWLAFLNSDAFPDPDWLGKLLFSAEHNPEFSFFACRQLQANAPHLLDGAGDAFHISGLAWRRYSAYPASQFGFKTEEVFSPCTAAALFSRRAFFEVDGFDEDIFTYHDDIDLGFRLRLQGFRCLYVPSAIVYHIGSVSVGAQSDFALYHWQRNYIWSFIQNMPSALLWEALPAHLMANIIHLIGFTMRGRGKVVLKAKMDAFRGFSRALSKRREIQKTRLVSHAELLRTMERGPLQPYLLGYYIRKIGRTIQPPGESP
jgi:GT2 family glycosyltransferase